MPEGKSTNASHAIRNCDTLQTTAPPKRSMPDASHAVGDCHARKTAATIEGIIADACHASVCRNNAILATGNKSFAIYGIGNCLRYGIFYSLLIPIFQ